MGWLVELPCGQFSSAGLKQQLDVAGKEMVGITDLAKFPSAKLGQTFIMCYEASEDYTAQHGKGTQ